MDIYINSLNISLFPCTKRESTYQKDRLFSEYNVTNMINQLLVNNGFVVTKDTSDQTFEFNLYGYNIRITANEGLSGLDYIVSFFSGSDSIYACINVSGLLPGYEEIVGLDDNSLYTGVKLTNQLLDTDIIYLKIAQYDTNTLTWNIPSDSYYIINSNNVNIEVIDGGEI